MQIVAPYQQDINSTIGLAATKLTKMLSKLKSKFYEDYGHNNGTPIITNFFKTWNPKLKEQSYSNQFRHHQRIQQIKDH